MKKLITLALVVCSLAIASFGQATATSYLVTATKLSAAVTTTSQTSVRVSSATGITAGSTMLYIEDGTGGPGEAMFVNSVSGTTIGVTRGYNGTQANTHLSGAVVLLGSPTTSYNPGPFVTVEPSGSCTAASSYTPTTNIFTGNQWICSSISASWVPGYFNRASTPGVTTAVASVAGATNPTGPLFHITGTNAITAWGSSTTAGLGAGGGAATQTYGAPFCVIPDAAYTTTATNNIAKATTAVANQMQCWVFDGTNGKYVPSY